MLGKRRGVEKEEGGLVLRLSPPFFPAWPAPADDFLIHQLRKLFSPSSFPEHLEKGKMPHLVGRVEGGRPAALLSRPLSGISRWGEWGGGETASRDRVDKARLLLFLPPPLFPHVVFPPKISLSLSILLGRARAEGGKAGVVARLPPQETFTQDPPPPVCHNVRHFFHYGKKKVLPSFFRFRKNPTVAFSS